MALIPQDVIHDIIQKIDIAEFISSYVPLKRIGRHYKGLCPFHNEKTPSFHVNTDKHIYHCFGCKAGGDVINFLMRHDAITFPEALEKLADKAGVVLPQNSDESHDADRTEMKRLADLMQSATFFYHKTLFTPKGLEARRYLEERGFQEQTMRDFLIGYAPEDGQSLWKAAHKSGILDDDLVKSGMALQRHQGTGYFDRFRGRVMIPILDLQSRTVAFGGRILRDGQPKYLNSPEMPLFNKSKVLFGLDKAKKGILAEKTALIVEGYLDCIQLHQAGIIHAVATLGTALTAAQVLLLKRFAEDVIIIYDSDEAGQVATLRAIDILVEQGMRPFVVTLEGAKDPDEYVRHHGAGPFLQYVQKHKKDFLEFKFSVLTKSHDRYSEVGKARIADDLFSTLQKIHHRIVQDQYIKKTALLLGLKEDVVVSEFKRQHAKSELVTQTRGEGANSSRVDDDAWDPVEKMLLVLVLKSEEYYKVTCAVQQRYGVLWRHRIMADVLDVFAKHGYRQGPDFFSYVQDERVRGLLVGMAMDESILPHTERQSLEDCLKRVVLRHIDREWRKLEEKWKEIRSHYKGEQSQALSEAWAHIAAEQNILMKKKQHIDKEGIWV